MKINLSVGKKTTTLRWEYLEEKISVRLPGRIDAKYSDSKKVIVASGTAGMVYILAVDGEKISEFSNNSSEECKFYCLASSVSNDLGVNMVMAHDPEINGERFWQHSIDINGQSVGDPILKWR